MSKQKQIAERAPIEQAIEAVQPIAELTAEYRKLVEEAAPLQKRIAKLKAKIVARVGPEDPVEGELYSDESITLTRRLVPATRDPDLLKLLEKQGYLEQATDRVVVAKKLEAFASIDPKVAKAREKAMTPQIMVKLTGGRDDDE